MKHIKYSILALSVMAIASVGCQSFLDQESSTALPADKAIASLQDANTALTGIYDQVQGATTSPATARDWYGARQIYRPDVAGDLMSANGPGKRCSSDFGLNYTGPASPNIWKIPYIAIRNCNRLIQAIDAGKITDGSAAVVNHIKGQALTIRALAHFDLARNYGKPFTEDNGVSLAAAVVVVPLSETAQPTRNTVAEVYTQVIKDLTEAIALMTNSKRAGFINQSGAKSLLSRVYLYKGDNQKAFDLAVDVITNGGYKLWTNAEYAGAWAKPGSAEMIWEITNFSSADYTDREGIAYLMSEDGYGDMILSKKASNYFNANPDDVRNKVLKASGNPDPKKPTDNYKNYGDNKVWLLKYPRREGETDIRVGNVSMLRLSEQYLIAAEAAIKLNDQANADLYLNAIVKRANPAAAAVTATLANVLWERGIELIGEGHRLYDLMRNDLECDRSGNWSNVTISNPASVTFNRDYFRVVLAIPQAELNANENMIQNPGYAS